MKNKKLYNVFFPIWLLFLDWRWILAAFPVNLAVDIGVLFLALFLLHRADKKQVIKKAWYKIYLFGFAADIIAAVGLFLAMLLCSLAPTAKKGFFAGGEEIAAALCTNPFENLFALLITLLFLALAAFLIYLFNKKFSFRGTDLSAGEIKFISILIAAVTAPYLYLLPTVWFV